MRAICRASGPASFWGIGGAGCPASYRVSDAAIHGVGRAVGCSTGAGLLRTGRCRGRGCGRAGLGGRQEEAAEVREQPAHLAPGRGIIAEALHPDATVSGHGPCHIKDAGPCCCGPAAGAGVTCSPKGLFHEPARAIQCQFLPIQRVASGPLHGPLTVAPERPASCCRAAISNGSPTPSHQHSFPRLETRSETGS
jgi:hypothetical protein